MVPRQHASHAHACRRKEDQYPHAPRQEVLFVDQWPPTASSAWLRSVTTMIAQKLHAAFLKSGKTLSLAESCTGGAVAAQLTALPGASQFFLGSLVAYSNAWKEGFLGVSSHTLQKHGAVSVETVREMVKGLFEKTACDYAGAISGIAGPTGGTPDKPVGTIYLAVGKRGTPINAWVIQAPKTRPEAIAAAGDALMAALLDLLS
ncbi:MAG: CinA family protein [Verrucomicrobiota bacterium]|nr:CinA family protein [Verrucomicrobiota bacterium]